MFAAQIYAQQKSSTATSKDASSQNSYDRSGEPEISEGMMEMRTRWRLRAEEKEFKEMLERSETAARLSEELKTTQAISSAKLVELEKVLKKIRKNLGGDEDDEKQMENKPANLADALARLSSSGAALSEELKTLTRYEINASSIELTNEMLELVQLIRTFSR